MIQFSAPAKYRAHLAAAIALALAEIGRDQSYRTDEDARVQKLAPIPDKLVDELAPGRVVVFIAEDSPEGRELLGDHLLSFVTAPA